MCGTRDHLDAFPQSIVNNSCTIFRRMAQAVCIVYALVRLAVASRAVHLLTTTINKCTYEPAWYR